MTLVSYEQLLRAPCREPDHVSPIDGVSEPDWRWYPGPSAAATDPVKSVSYTHLRAHET